MDRFNHTQQMVANVTGTLFLSGVLAFDALSLGLTPVVTKTLAFVFFGVFFRPILSLFARTISKSSAKFL